MKIRLVILAVAIGLLVGAGVASGQLAWEHAVEGTAPLGGGFGDPNNQDSHDAAVFDGSLFVATTNWSTGCEVWRTTADSAWTQANPDGFESGETAAWE